MSRLIEFTYQDPLELVWIAAAAALGMNLIRDDEVFASWDGKGTLRIGTTATLDADDSVAQMVFHEICHAAVEGPEGFRRPDWGLDITDPRQAVHERACLRLQAALAGPHGLREFFAATTNFRAYYDCLPADPLAAPDDASDAAAAMARAARRRLSTWPASAHVELDRDQEEINGTWEDVVQRALAATAAIAKIVRPIAPHRSLWRQSEASR